MTTIGVQKDWMSAGSPTQPAAPPAPAAQSPAAPLLPSPPAPSDVELLARIGRGDMAALGQLVGRHQSHVLDLAYRFAGRWDLAEDVAQETFLRIWRSASRFKPSAAFTTWLYRIVVNLCIDAARRPRAVALSLDAPAAESAAPVEVDETRHAVQNAIAALPPRQRIAVVLHRFRAMTHAQIAAATGWSLSSVESLLVRAYAQLRKSLADWAT